MQASSPGDRQRNRARLATIREDISSRLWPVTAGMTSGSFNELVDQMARIQLQGEQGAEELNRVASLRPGRH